MRSYLRSQTVSSIGLSLVNTQSQLIDQRLDAVRLGADRGFSVQGLGKNVPVCTESEGKGVVYGKGSRAPAMKTVWKIPTGVLGSWAPASLAGIIR